MMYPAGTRVGFSRVWVRVPNLVTRRKPVPLRTRTRVYMAGLLNLEFTDGHATHATNACRHHQLYSLYQPQ